MAQKRAGRPPGAKDRKPRVTAARKLAAAAAAEGITPLDVMLRAMRAAWERAQEEDDPARQLVALRAATDIAKDAAPYVHPRLAAVDHTSDGEKIAPYVIMGEPEAEDADAWQAQHAR